MRILIVLLLAACLSFTCCCEEQTLTSGVIVEKNYEPEARWSIPTTVIIDDTVITVPIFQHRAECWSVTIKGEVNGQIKTASYCVTPNEYEELSVGDIYTVPLPRKENK